MPHSSLDQHLNRLRQRTIVLGVSAGLGWALTGGLILMLVWVWLDLVFELPAGLRIGLRPAIAACAVLFTLRAAVGAWRRGSARALARIVDGTAQSGGQVLTGVELSTESRPMGDMSRGLAAIAVDRAAEFVAGLARQRAVPARPVVRAFAVTCVLILTVVAVAVIAPRLAAAQWLRFADPYGDHPPYSRVQFDVEPGHAEVIYGRGLDIQVTTHGPPVEDVDLVLRSKDGTAKTEKLGMFPQPDGSWRVALGRVTSPAQYCVQAGRARSHRFDIKVLTVPQFESVRYRITPPVYTNRSAYEGPLPEGGLAGLPGTQVHVWAKSNRPLSHGTLTVDRDGGEPSSGRMDPTDSEADTVAGAFTIEAPGKLTLNIADTAGQNAVEEYSVPIALLPDTRPFVRILQPVATSLATPDAELPVELSAEDDYGVSSLELYRSLNDSRATPLKIPVPSRAATRVPTSISLPLSAYGLQPGDVIKLFARVEDNDPAGTKGSESTVVTVHVISSSDYQRMLLAREGMELLLSKYHQAERRMEGISEEIDALSRELEEAAQERPLDEESRRRLETLRKRMREEAAAIEQAANTPLPFDLDASLTPALRELAERLRKAAGKLDELAGGNPTTGQARDKLGEAGKACKGSRERFAQEAIAPIDRLAEVFPLLEDQARFTALYGRQRDLAERLASLEGRDGEDNPRLRARMRDLEEQQRAVGRSLEELLDDIDNHVAALPEDSELDELRETAREFSKAVRASGADAAMTEAAAGLAEFSGTRGAEGSRTAADILEKFLSKCQGMGQKGGQCRMPLSQARHARKSFYCNDL